MMWRAAIGGGLLAWLGIAVREVVDGLRAQLVHYAAFAWLLPSLTLLFGLGLVASRSRPLRLWGLTVGPIGRAIVPAQLFIVPAIANAITLKYFTEESIRLLDRRSVAYLIALNYEFGFYSRRSINAID